MLVEGISPNGKAYKAFLTNAWDAKCLPQSNEVSDIELPYANISRRASSIESPSVKTVAYCWLVVIVVYTRKLPGYLSCHIHMVLVI